MKSFLNKIKQKNKLYVGLLQKVLSYFLKEFKDMSSFIIGGGLGNIGIYILSLSSYLYVKIEWCGLVTLLDVVCFNFFIFIVFLVYTVVVKVKNKNNEIS